MTHSLNNYSGGLSSKQSDFTYKVGQFQAAPVTPTYSKTDTVLLKKQNIAPGIYHSTIIDAEISNKFDDAIKIVYRLKRKLNNGNYDSAYTDVAFTYFQGNLHFQKLDDTLTQYGLTDIELSHLIGLQEEVTVTYLPNDKYGFFEHRKMITPPTKAQNLTAKSDSSVGDDDELPF